jgi:hypothetical protein
MAMNFGEMARGEHRMRLEFFAIQTVGAAIALTGVAVLAAMPLPDFRWYNRLAVVVIMGCCTCLVLVVDVAVLATQRHVDPVGFAPVSLALGLIMIGILYSTIRTAYNLYPTVASRYVSAVKLMSAGIALQVVPSLLGLVGVRLW